MSALSPRLRHDEAKHVRFIGHAKHRLYVSIAKGMEKSQPVFALLDIGFFLRSFVWRCTLIALSVGLSPFPQPNQILAELGARAA